MFFNSKLFFLEQKNSYFKKKKKNIIYHEKFQKQNENTGEIQKNVSLLFTIAQHFAKSQNPFTFTHERKSERMSEN